MDARPVPPPLIDVSTPPRPPPVEDDAGPYCSRLVLSTAAGMRSDLCPADGGTLRDAGLAAINMRTCLPAPPDGQSCAETYDDTCVLYTFRCYMKGKAIACGPLPDAEGGQCCYVVVGDCPPGRPFFVEGHARLAAANRSPGWSASSLPAVNELDAATRGALADVWTQNALAEHASIASFSRFVLQCLSAGAPAEIVEGAARACADEIEHARTAFGLASAYAGRPIGPGPLDVEGALDDVDEPADIAFSVATEGCIAELVSARFLEIAAGGAEDAVVRALLARMAKEEMDHALLAWKYVAWAYRTGDVRVAAQIARAFDRMHEHVALGPLAGTSHSTAQMRAHGYLGVEERRRIAKEVLEQVVGPAARALMASGGLLAAARGGTSTPPSAA